MEFGDDRGIFPARRPIRHQVCAWAIIAVRNGNGKSMPVCKGRPHRWFQPGSNRDDSLQRLQLRPGLQHGVPVRQDAVH